MPPDEPDRQLEDLLAQPGSRLAEVIGALSRDQRADLFGNTSLREVTRGEVVVAQGQAPAALGYLLEGVLGMRKSLPDGREHIIGILAPSDMFGRLVDGPMTYDIVALGKGRLAMFERAGLERILADSPEAERLLLVNVLDELDSAREWILLMGGHRVTERVASLLLVLLRRVLRRAGPDWRPGTPLVVDFPISRTDLAHHLGTRAESLSRALHELQDDGVIDLVNPSTVRIVNLAALVRISGTDLLVAEGR